MDWMWIGPVVTAGVVIPAAWGALSLNQKFKTHEATDKLRFQQIANTLSEIKEEQKEQSRDIKTLVQRHR